METGRAGGAGTDGTQGDGGTHDGDDGTQGDGGGTCTGAEPVWRALPPGLLRMRRLLLALWTVLLALLAGVLPGLFAGPAWAASALLPCALGGWAWWLLGRNWRSWRYAERADDLLISRGVLWHEETVVPYGRMQLVEVTSGPVQRRFGLAGIQLHTAAAATDAAIPGLVPEEAERLRDRLTELGEARSAGL
ncbi:PH domain-containing protein [Streptomyces sp. J2-1]|uniref:PH domain-containing protein n=1 Tax=Streptomyces corallincola TaxID=2851888 RepID=UPI001C383C5C|nr:PH domain-containing protein [Streptomyces corallincola]MBV2354626.1 PH domain-containing protein [Streptomyces corallincola]